MGFFKKWPTVIGFVIGVLIYIVAFCSIKFACYRIDETGDKSYRWFSLMKGLYSPFKQMFYALGEGYYLSAFFSFFNFRNPWFVIPTCVIISNLALKNKFKK